MYLEQENFDNYWALDIETDDLLANVIWCVCVESYFGTKAYFTSKEEFNLWYKNQKPTLITHNGLSFDVPVLNRLWNSKIKLSTVIDTLVLSQLYWPNMPKPSDYTGPKGAHSLDCWGHRLRFPKLPFKDFSEFTPEMLEYCENDAALTMELYKRLRKRMVARGWSEKSAQIEHHFRYIIDIQESNGFYFDSDNANSLLHSLRDMERGVEEKIREFFPPRLKPVRSYTTKMKGDGTYYASYYTHLNKYPKLEFSPDKSEYTVYDYEVFNIGSPKQRIERLLEHGWKPKNRTAKGNPKVDEESILDFAEESGIPQVALIKDWLVYNARANMIKTWLDAVQDDGCIHGTVFSCGAGSRRCTHSSPNTANVVGVDKPYGKEARGLWIARPNRVLVGADASGLEGRVQVHYLATTSVPVTEVEEFMLGDPHTANANALTAATGVSIERKPSKSFLYAFLYGASDTKLGSMAGGGKALGAIIRATLTKNIPGLEELTEMVSSEYTKNNGLIQCIDGGYVRCPSPHAALNYKFQSCGAIIMKQGAINLTKTINDNKYDAMKVGDIHDEWQYDCLPSHGELVGKAACEAMTLAGEQLNLNIKLDGEYNVGRSWADTH